MNFSGTTSTSIIHGGSAIGGQTPMTPIGAGAGGESVTDPSTGIAYWHYIVGDPASGFAEEVYIQKGGGCYGGQGTCSASSGVESLPGSTWTPLSTSISNGGAATGNPNRVILRMVLGGTWNAGTSTWTCDTSFCSEFVKSAYANKPKITEGINDPTMTAKFIMDMSGVALSNNSTSLTVTDGSTGATGASLTNVLTITDPTSGTVSSFDMARDAQITNVTGGKYTYVDGTGRLQSAGTYVYTDGQFDPLAVDYTMFFDKTVSNPWAYSANKP